MSGNVIIAGAGIGGLTAALTLAEAGFRVALYESVREIRPLGVGVNLLPHGAEVLHGLGLGAALDATGVRTRAIEYRTKYGHLITGDARGIEAGFAFPQYSIHRGALQHLLLDAVRARLGDVVRSGHRAHGFREEPDAVALLVDGPEGLVEITGDFLIGADGFHSAIRAQLHPTEGPAHADGMMMYRGAARVAPFGDGRTMFIAGNHDLKFVCYPMSVVDPTSGTCLVNWVAEVRHAAPRPADQADWTQQGGRDFIHLFADFSMPDIDILALMQASETITEYPMIDRDPLASWGQGRVSLLGDAAHPMFPIGANGSSQAILDARALADALAAAPGAEGLRAYEADRLPKTAAIVRANRARGPERVLDIADARLSGPNNRVEDLITAAEIEAVAKQYRQVAGFLKTGERT